MNHLQSDNRGFFPQRPDGGGYGGAGCVPQGVPYPDPSGRKGYIGSVKKCPACGQEIPSFTAFCPACGHELNFVGISGTLERFAGEINRCEQFIANAPYENKTGWSSWRTGKKVWWVIFNIFFRCIPLVIYLVLPMIRIRSTPRLSREERNLASLIENFPFPNDRESILEALLFTKEKIDFIAKENIDQKSAYWMRLWCSKAAQLKQKADLMFPNDSVVEQSYAEILEDKKRVNDQIKVKVIVGSIIFLAAIVFIVGSYTGFYWW